MVAYAKICWIISGFHIIRTSYFWNVILPLNSCPCVLRIIILQAPFYLSLNDLSVSFFFFLVFLGLHPRHMEVPRLEVAVFAVLHQQCGIQALDFRILSKNPGPDETTAHGNARSLTHWTRPVIEHASSWILVRVISTEPWQELPHALIYGFIVKQVCFIPWHSDGFLEWLLIYSGLPKFLQFPHLWSPPGTSTTTCITIWLYPYQF